MATYEQLCGCVVEIEKGVTRTTFTCEKHAKGESLSFGGAWQAGTGVVAVPHMAPVAPADVSEFGVPKFGQSLLGKLWESRLFGGKSEITKEALPDTLDVGMHSHTLCDEQVDFLNLTLSRERVELLQERRQWVNLRKQDRTAGLNRITEIDSELAMIDSITLKLKRIP